MKKILNVISGIVLCLALLAMVVVTTAKADINIKVTDSHRIVSVQKNTPQQYRYR